MAQYLKSTEMQTTIPDVHSQEVQTDILGECKEVQTIAAEMSTSQSQTECHVHVQTS